MCGRFTLRTPNAILLEAFALDSAIDLPPRFNIAPTQTTGVIRRDDGQRRELVAMQWGLIPSWTKDPARSRPLIHARSETAAEKPTFRSAWKRRRCLVVADGFYEWQTVGKEKLPYHVRRHDGRPFAFAGLWERSSRAAPPLDTFAILTTTSAGSLLESIHHRSPVILSPDDYDAWLDPNFPDLDHLAGLMAPSCDAETYVMGRVGTRVNNSRYDQPDCLE